MKEEMKRIGIDLGGHTIVAGLVIEPSPENPPRLERRLSVETPPGRGKSLVMSAIAELVSTLAVGEAVCGVGIAVPGMVDADRRHARRLPNFPTSEWDDLDVPEALAATLAKFGLDLPTAVENDANCYALGEGAAGAAAGSDNFVVFTLGTGIGGGIVVNGALLTGFHGMAGETGHIVVAGDAPCGCGGAGHVETFAAADGTGKRAIAAGLPEEFRDLWRLRGERHADAVLEPGLDALARAIAGVCHILDPEMVILGGGMSKAEGIRDAVHERTLRYLSRPFKDKLDLRVSLLGNDAALYGAAIIGAQASE